MSIKSLFGFGPAAELTITLDGADTRATIRHPAEKTKLIPLFREDELVQGALHVAIPEGKRLEHAGVKIEFVGVIEMPHERQSVYEFTSLIRELDGAGAIDQEKTYTFDFSSVEKPHESYYGRSVRLRYYIRATVTRSYASNVVQEQDLWVQILGTPPPMNNTIKMEVGIEDCLHIEFEYDKSKYHLKDVVIGKIFFLLVRIKIKHMELAIIRREIVGGGSEKHNESETLTKFEIMDGAPVKGESIPVRLYLAPYPLTPTHRNVQNKFSIKYFLNLVLVDEEDRRYFKQQEITIWRKTIG
uniref:Vacuolar protein sorting-associated protein 26 n=1 Tax=Globisporangium ultimum (strain ATCC 200006 / CBS 805.95 / DAOM BR144) TaxID=431595 RepID=K3WQS7_GLOUD